jgi:hypothetical protein
MTTLDSEGAQAARLIMRRLKRYPVMALSAGMPREMYGKARMTEESRVVSAMG